MIIEEISKDVPIFSKTNLFDVLSLSLSLSLFLERERIHEEP